MPEKKKVPQEKSDKEFVRKDLNRELFNCCTGEKMKEELVKMSAKGQLVVPREIREMEKFKAHDRFVAIGVKSGVLFKRIKIPSVKKEFASLSKEIAKQFRERNIKERDVEEAIKWVRQR